MRKFVFGITMIVLMVFLSSCLPKKPPPAIPAGEADLQQCVGDVEQGRATQACESCRRAVEADPDSVTAHAYLARALVMSDQKEAAVTEYLKSISLDPSSLKSRLELAGLYKSMNRTDEALTQYEIVLESQPDYIEAVQGTADLFEQKGDTRNAVIRYRHLVELNPENEMFYLRLAEIQASAGQNPDARATYQEGLKHCGDSPALLSNYAVFLQKTKNYQESAQIYERIMKTDPEYPNIHYNLTLSYYRAGDMTRAKKNLNQFLETAQPRAENYLLAGSIQLEMSDWDGARRSLQKAVQLDPRNADAHVTLGHVLKYMGDKDGALEEYRTALKINPDHQEAKTSLKQLLGVPKIR